MVAAKIKYVNFFSFLIVVLMILSCARTINPDIERGTNYQFKKDYPEIRLAAMGTFNEQNSPQINITANIVYGSLIFRQSGNKKIAELTVGIRIFDLHNNNALVHSKEFSHNHKVENNQLTQSQNIFTLQKKIGIKPGKYKIVLTLTDQATSKTATRIANTEVPNPYQDSSSLTNIRMLGKETGNNNWSPITTYDIPGKIDSLKLVYQIINRTEHNTTLNSKLIKFQSDTSFAKPLNRVFGSSTTLFNKGIDYDNKEVIQSNKRILTQNGNISVEFYFATLPRGNYRFEVDGTKKTNSDLYKARDFSLKSKNYPTLKTPKELAKPLIYLMNPKEYENLIAINNQDSLKQAVDRFWLKNIGSASTAKSVIRLYYKRVQEANKLFSNFKEGWKTDRGMLYILFGPPWYVDKIHQQLHWSYTYNLSNSDLNFSFSQVKVQSEYFPFQHFVLERQSSYYTILNRQKQLWLSGQILVQKI